MKQESLFIELDSVIDSMEIVLSKNRSSLSIEDLALLEKCKTSLIELNKVSSNSDRKEILKKMLPDIIKLLFNNDVNQYFGKVLEFFDTCN